MRELLMCENCRGLYTVGAPDSTNHLCPFCAREMRLKVDTAINGQPGPARAGHRRHTRTCPQCGATYSTVWAALCPKCSRLRTLAQMREHHRLHNRRKKEQP